ncbi:hypothetical protein SAMN05660657_00255 [Geodermatophilus amargosae]|uniref:Uncharacterized protein n=1 Tax=Geodermatophilus amargosae TaxID=1296565 RepID=A0A1I6X8C1_9ACTN|nr:hypothetical protein SAMN05660657_00255 [Geodermatophilus amargosae]
MPVGSVPRRTPRPVLSTGLALLSTVAALLGGGVLLATPALAVDDPSRPDARVTHGPSCRPGGVAVEVTAGTVAYAVTLATTRSSEGEDAAELEPGQTVVLRTGDVDWGETIDSRLEYAALDGSGTTYVDELDGFSFTRPAEEDCAAITAPPTAEVPEIVEVPAAPVPSPSDAPPAGGVAPEVVPIPVPGLPAPGTAPGAPADGPPAGAVVASASAAQVAAGGRVVVTAAGFGAGEQVTVTDADGAVLGSATATEDGAVEVVVQMPDGGAPGPTTIELVGADSALTASVQLRVAAASSAVDPDPLPLPLVAAGLALVTAATGLVLVGARRPPSGDPTGSA